MIIVVILLSVTSLISCSVDPTDGYLVLHMIDVGQGDCFLLTTPLGQNILIDAGDPAQSDRIAGYLNRHRIKGIDHLIVSHPHGDHIGGMPELLDRFPIQQIYVPAVIHHTSLYEALLTKTDYHQIPLYALANLTTIWEEPDIKIQILTTGKDYGEHLNNWSLVVRVIHGAQSFLFTGDMEMTAEADLLAAFPSALLKSTVLKAGHHGSNTSTSENFLAAVSPQVVLISCGKDNFHGHPHQDVLDRLEKKSIWVYRTDLQGTVVLYSDGLSLFSYQAPANLIQ